MTVTAAVRREAFAVVGADSLVSDVRPVKRLQRKVAWHARVPVAFAAGGLAQCFDRHGDVRYVAEVLQDFADAMTGAESLSSVIAELQETLGTPFAKSLRTVPSQHYAIEVAVVGSSGRAEVATTVCTSDGWALRSDPHAVYGGPQKVVDYVDRLTPEQRRFEGLDDEDSLANAVRARLFDCIDVSPSDCGPPVDVVLVRANGARLLDSPARSIERKD